MLVQPSYNTQKVRRDTLLDAFIALYSFQKAELRQCAATEAVDMVNARTAAAFVIESKMLRI